MANGVDVRVDAADGYTPTPAVSHAILVANRDRPAGGGLADGIVVTPSHNPPEDGGFKYNPPNGGPADTDVTRWIQDEANRILEASGSDGLDGIARVPFERARASAGAHDFMGELRRRPRQRRRHGGDRRRRACGSASTRWAARRSTTGARSASATASTSPSPTTPVDPTFGFMTLDWDGRIRMDPSSPFAMARLVELRDRFDLALGNDADADRHGIVVPGAGLMNPNHVLAAAIAYLFGGARGWGADVGVGKTLVSSSMIDRVVADLGRRLVEVPVGFKWFVDGLVDGSIGFGGEESAGASFLRRDGTVWTTDKDGIIAVPARRRADRADRAQPGRGVRGADRAVRGAGLPPDRRPGDAGAEGRPRPARGRPTCTATTLAGDPITAILTTAPGNGAPIGGLKVTTAEALVRRPAVGHGERHQAVRGELPRRGAPRDRARGGRRDRGAGDGVGRRRRRLGVTSTAPMAWTGWRSALGDGSG